eukprot:TRINITY_DN3250_c0_g1_i2.p1 TRINITY_DN3250_c0_g1~~TRINITY_DN3250_c0_g1_i2.p1  ORF type:complete len:461 (+),score=128.10 TRINITY_DN3250_c0_g1_i2:54-1436(+)
MIGAVVQGRGRRNFSSPAIELPQFNHQPQKYVGPSLEEVLKKRKKFLSPALLTYYKQPVMIVEGKNQYLFDEKGKRYLDAFAGIVTVSVGHSQDKVVQAGVDQMKKLMHTTTIYLHPEVALYGEELAKKMPGNLKVTYFVNSGSEANDLALLIARLYTGSNDVITLRNGYHGMSLGAMGLTALHTWKYPVSQGHGIHHALNPDTYRGPYGPDVPDVGKKYAHDVKNLIEHATPGRVAAFIAETVQGVGGAVPLANNYLPEVYHHIRQAGGLCIADEVQTGFGRCGTHYWGFETQGVIPDVVTLAKGIGNGIPLAAVVTTPEIAEVLSKRLHFNTYGGNPVSSAIGRSVLKVIDEENLQKNCLDVGHHLSSGLLKLKEKYKLIGDVRGKGLMLGLELVKDRNTKEPAKEETAQVFERAKELGLLLGKGGLYGNVFKSNHPCVSAKKMLTSRSRSWTRLSLN